MAKTSTVSGTVLDDGGHKVAGAGVSCKDVGTNVTVSTTSDSNGRFSFTETEGHTYVIAAAKNGVTTSTGLKY